MIFMPYVAPEVVQRVKSETDRPADLSENL